MDGRFGKSSGAAAALTLALVSGVLASAAYGVPGRLVWGGDAVPRTASPDAHREPGELRLTDAPALAPVPMRYAPGWVPAGLREMRRHVSVSGSPSTSVRRVWVAEADAAHTDPGTGLFELAARPGREPPSLTVEVEHAPERVTLGRVLHDAAGEPGGYEVSGDSGSFGWDPEPGVSVRVSQRGLGLDRATMYRIARSVRPVADRVAWPLHARRLPAGLTALTWNTWVDALLHPDGRGGWTGSVNWCLALEITVDATGPREAARSWWPQPGGPTTWSGVRRLDEHLSKTMVSVARQPGTVVTASVLSRTGHPVPHEDLARIAAAVEVPH
jgi:hypothetical protein